MVNVESRRGSNTDDKTNNYMRPHFLLFLLKLAIKSVPHVGPTKGAVSKGGFYFILRLKRNQIEKYVRPCQKSA